MVGASVGVFAHVRAMCVKWSCDYILGHSTTLPPPSSFSSFSLQSKFNPVNSIAKCVYLSRQISPLLAFIQMDL